MIELIIKQEYGWNHYVIGEYDLWFKGYIFNGNVKSFLMHGMQLLQNDAVKNSEIEGWLTKTQGHFSFVIASNESLLCGVDHVRSIPLFYSINGVEIKIGVYAPSISKSIDFVEMDKQAALEILMSGYTVGKKTLNPMVSQLLAGEFLISKNGNFNISRYYQYSPWNTIKRPKSQLKEELADISLQVLEDMVQNAGGRQLVVPLSAGNDSRFIVSGLKELGVKDVFCFSYGVNNNFEVETAKQVADHLEYPWHYVPLSITSQKNFFSEREFLDFWRFTDTLSNHPVLIDYSAVKLLKESHKISQDAIFVNGNSGDFITGGHLLLSSNGDSDFTIDNVIEKIINKHYSLWDCLKTKDNTRYIYREIKSYIELMADCGAPLDDLSLLAESLEWDGRQSKIVTTTQRSYEFHGYEWRLPMWDPKYMNFWQGVEKEYKLNQALYVEMLLEKNWGGVWSRIQVNNHTIASDKLRLFRNMMKLFFVFFGKGAWHRFDKRVFSYYYDDTAATAIESYRNVLFDNCGARNRNSWITKRYLAEKGFDFALALK